MAQVFCQGISHALYILHSTQPALFSVSLLPFCIITDLRTVGPNPQHLSRNCEQSIIKLCVLLRETHDYVTFADKQAYWSTQESAVPAKSVLAWSNTSNALGLSHTPFICIFRFVIVKYIVGLRWKARVQLEAVLAKSLCTKDLWIWQGYTLQKKVGLAISSVVSLSPKLKVWLLLSLNTVKGDKTPIGQYHRHDTLMVPK